MTATAGGTATGRRRMAVRICRGGWPSDLGVADDDAMQSNIDYLEVVAEIDLERMDGVRRGPALVARFILW